MTGIVRHAWVMTITDALTTERADILETLAKHRGFLRQTAQGLTDEQARLTPTASQLCVGGLIKHVSLVEANWARFIVDGPQVEGPPDEGRYAAHAAGFRMEQDGPLPGGRRAYGAVAARADGLVVSLPSLDVSQPLPEAPWFPPGARWSARRVVLHLVAAAAPAAR